MGKYLNFLHLINSAENLHWVMKRKTWSYQSHS